MYEVDDEKIGTYLDNAIKKHFESSRQFAKKYLILRHNNPDPSPEEISNMSNRISQIKQGNKGIQIQDLPYFAHLLGVSVDDILSGGTYCKPASERLTNYSVAFSKDQNEWEEYINHPDKLILNPDEYGKTVIDYALEFKNYALLKYLMEKKYIWFVSENSDEYWGSFGAGTSIERRTFQESDLLNVKLKERDDLRTGLITLAIGNKDFDILDTLHAREIPALYEAFHNVVTPLDFKKYYNPSMLEAIAGSAEDVMVYFSKEYEVQTNRNCICQYTFPYLGNLLDLVVKKDKKAAAKMLKNALKHNKFVLSKIEKIADLSAKGLIHLSPKNPDYDFIKEQIMNNYRYFKDNDTVCFRTASMPGIDYDGVFSNIIRVSVSSKDEYIKSLIEDVNESYKQISKYQYKWEG